MDSPLEQLLQFLRYPSISTEKHHSADVVRCAEWLTQILTDIGLSADLHPTGGHPIVLARNRHQPNRRTVLIYGHYDVQPVDPLNEWKSPPFEPQIVDGCIRARGATDNKGQIFAHVQGVRAMLQQESDLPVNLIFLIEGEEEIGSIHLEDFLKRRRNELACDVIAISDTGMVQRGIPTLTYGTRGITGVEVKVRGPGIDLHSGIFGGAVANPATAVARLIATLHDADGRIAVAGFYDDVVPLQEWERENWKRLPVNDEVIRQLTGARELFGESGYTAVERIWGRPTLEANGIGGGFQGEGSKTVIPKEAFVKLTCRLAPNQVPDKIANLVVEHLQRNCPPGVTLELTTGHGGEPYVMDPMSRDGQAAQRALRKTFDRDVALTREGGTIPILQTFRKIFGVDILLLGLAIPECRLHAPNEIFPLENFEAGIRLNQELLRELAANK
jgi:acetylornithine deacetylase/succinyl-diaminopimelate desuccinylase-like protein